MAKQISITLSGYVYEAHIAPFEGNNRSERIEKLILLGSLVEEGAITGLRADLIKLKNDYDLLTKENNKLKAENARLKKDDWTPAERLAEGLRANNPWQ